MQSHQNILGTIETKKKKQPWELKIQVGTWEDLERGKGRKKCYD